MYEETNFWAGTAKKIVEGENQEKKQLLLAYRISTVNCIDFLLSKGIAERSRV